MLRVKNGEISLSMSIPFIICDFISNIFNPFIIVSTLKQGTIINIISVRRNRPLFEGDTKGCKFDWIPN